MGYNLNSKEILAFMRILEGQLDAEEKNEYINEGKVMMKHVYDALDKFAPQLQPKDETPYINEGEHFTKKEGQLDPNFESSGIKPTQAVEDAIFKIGENAFLKHNPLDEQLGHFISVGDKTITEVKDVSDIPHTSGQWVKIAEYNDWLDSAHFQKTQSVEDRALIEYPKIEEDRHEMSYTLNRIRREAYIKGATDNQDTFKKIMDKTNEIQDFIKGVDEPVDEVREAAESLLLKHQQYILDKIDHEEIQEAWVRLEQALNK